MVMQPALGEGHFVFRISVMDKDDGGWGDVVVREGSKERLLKDETIFKPIHYPFHMVKLSRTILDQATPYHDATTPMLHYFPHILVQILLSRPPTAVTMFIRTKEIEL